MTVRDAEPSEAGTIRAILRDCGLPDDIAPGEEFCFLIAEEEGRAAGTIGLESYGRTGLLRSAAVLAGSRSRRIGEALVRGLLARAASKGLREVVLLTTDAASYFARYGFREIPRSSVPPEVRNTSQFTWAHCSSAVVMRLDMTDFPEPASSS